MESLVNRLEAAVLKLESLPSQSSPLSPAPSTSSTTSPTSLLELDKIINSSLVEYTNSSKTIGGLVAEQSGFVVDAFTALRGIVSTAGSSKKPNTTQLPGIIAPLQFAIGKVVGIKDTNRSSKQFNHLSLVAEGIPAMGWVVVEPTPVPYVNDMKDAALFYVNRVIKEFKGV
jgi:adenylyl cyclase-associated protein